MKNIFVFYAFIFLPLLALILGGKYNFIPAQTFVWCLAIYVLVYHPLVSGLRLVEAQKIRKGQIWLSFNPFFNWKYFSYLFFNKN